MKQDERELPEGLHAVKRPSVLQSQSTSIKSHNYAANLRYIMHSNSNFYLVKINVHTEIGRMPSICCYQNIERKRYSDINQRPRLCYKFAKIVGNNSNLDIVKINAYTKFGQIRSICSKDIEQKQNSDINQGP